MLVPAKRFGCRFILATIRRAEHKTREYDDAVMAARRDSYYGAQPGRPDAAYTRRPPVLADAADWLTASAAGIYSLSRRRTKLLIVRLHAMLGLSPSPRVGLYAPALFMPPCTIYKRYSRPAVRPCHQSHVAAFTVRATPPSPAHVRLFMFMPAICSSHVRHARKIRCLDVHSFTKRCTSSRHFHRARFIIHGKYRSMYEKDAAARHAFDEEDIIEVR